MKLDTEKLFNAIDAMDSDAFVSFIAPQGVFRFGNGPEAVGRENIKAAVNGFFGAIKALKHHIDNIWIEPHHILSQGEVTYTRKDGSTITLPFANIFEMESGLIKGYSVYIDVAPLFAPGKTP